MSNFTSVFLFVPLSLISCFIASSAWFASPILFYAPPVLLCLLIYPFVLAIWLHKFTQRSYFVKYILVNIIFTAFLISISAGISVPASGIWFWDCVLFVLVSFTLPAAAIAVIVRIRENYTQTNQEHTQQ